jgi:hypothetical protein
MVLVYWRKRSDRGSIRSEIRSSVPMVFWVTSYGKGLRIFLICPSSVYFCPFYAGPLWATRYFSGDS